MARNKSLVFDSGPIISLTTSNLLWVLDYLKADFEGDFYLPLAVKEELVDYPIKTKKFKFEALQVYNRINKRVLQLLDNSDPRINDIGRKLEKVANRIYSIKGKYLTLFHPAEMDVLASALILNASAVVIDERSTRLLIENTDQLLQILKEHLRADIDVDQENLAYVKKELKNLRAIRSTELVMIAYEKGFLDKYLINRPDARKILLESLLWIIKLHGCAISRREIDEIIRIEQDEKTPSSEMNTI